MNAKNISSAIACKENGNYRRAIELFSEILNNYDSEKIVDVSCAEIYALYGETLFLNYTQESTRLFGDEPKNLNNDFEAEDGTQNVNTNTNGEDGIDSEESDSNSEDSDEVQESVTDEEIMNKKIIDFDGKILTMDDNDEESDEEENEGFESKVEELTKFALDKVKELEDDLQLAWESLEVARAIYLDTETSSQKLVVVYSLLGDVLMESESFDKAIMEYQSAIEYGKNLPEYPRRLIAQLYYKIALSKDNLHLPEEAIEYLTKCTCELKQIEEKDKEIYDLINELENKMEDLKTPGKPVVVEEENSAEGIEKEALENCVDITNLVKTQ